MRSAFSFDDDKQLVQFAREYAEAGTRICWSDVEGRVRHTGHPAAALQQRLRTLMRTWGTNVRHVPPNFYTTVRPLVRRDKSTPHRNVEEMLPAGVTSLLAELTIESTDLFFDIGAGLGNIVMHVIIGTNKYKTIGTELRHDVHRVGLEIILKSSLQYERRLRERGLFVCRDVMDIGLSVALPYANATIVYWNSIWFEPHVVEYVKIQLCGMPMIRYLVCFVNLCPRHRDLCS
ncbi:Histone methylation protein [Phytophthora palmivora]|uniref:Histone methylation protein n=1 Tax=Phytophthora palmivora TaxID=4796 RepID=A0A2P4YKT3_9STRA|nr:Histone methylation protein [Phytophthora palmivora]